MEKQTTYVQGDNALEFVGVPLLELAVLADAEEVVRLGHELHGHDALLVGVERSVTVAEVHAPDLDVAVGRAGHDEPVVERDVHAEDGLLVAVQVEEELERVDEEHLDGGVE